MGETKSDVFTVPNALTATRLALSPLFADKLHEDPRKWWLPTAAFMISDIVDGHLARAGDQSEKLAKLGFRRSELGRKLDPVTDKIVGSEMLIAGMRAGVVPKSLGGLALAQKMAISAHTLYETARGAELQVSQLGKHSEFLTNLGFGSLFAAESLNDPHHKQLVRTTGLAVGLVGIAGAVAADLSYARAARQQTG